MAVRIDVYGAVGQRPREQAIMDVGNLLFAEGAEEITVAEAPGTIYELRKGEQGCSVNVAEIRPVYLRAGRTYGLSLDLIGSGSLCSEDSGLVRALRNSLTGLGLEVVVSQLPHHAGWSLPGVYDAASLPK